MKVGERSPKNLTYVSDNELGNEFNRHIQVLTGLAREIEMEKEFVVVVNSVVGGG
jgi:hypothetical protein